MEKIMKIVRSTGFFVCCVFIVLFILIGLLLYGISKQSPEESERFNQRQLELEYIGHIRVVEYDGCEYIFYNRSYQGSVAHKGNCKYCADRNKKLK